MLLYFIRFTIMFPPLLYPDLTPKITEPTWFNVDTPVNQLEELDRLEEEFKDWVLLNIY